MAAAVDAYIESLPDEQQQIAATLRQLILSLVPGVQEKLSFKIPFYHYFGMFCYINKVPGGIALCFCRGKDLLDAFPELEIKNRAIIACITLGSKKDIAQHKIADMITAAAYWNEEAKRLKIPMVKKQK
ncbi:MAG: DUF1801 domain-containing protein [Ferruginibacter sp.]